MIPYCGGLASFSVAAAIPDERHLGPLPASVGDEGTDRKRSGVRCAIVRPPTVIGYRMFKEKSVVRHKMRPEWGVGRVLLRTADYLHIEFAQAGLKKLKPLSADEHLEAASADELKATPPKAKSTRKRDQ